MSFILNKCPTDLIMITINNTPLTSSLFPGGEAHISLQDVPVGDCTVVWAFLESADEIMKLLLCMDALRREAPEGRVELHLPYMPYARQDRVCNPGEALSVRVMANLINSLQADSVTLYDPHSDVVGALIDRVRIVPQHALLQELTPFILDKSLALVAPDAGAEKKTHQFAQSLPAKVEILYGSKVRDTQTGAITGTTVRGDATGRGVLLIDDICDGGRTFIELAKVLRAEGAEEIYLYVTHGIFSKGVEALTPYFDHLYCYFAFPDVTPHNQLTILSQR